MPLATKPLTAALFTAFATFVLSANAEDKRHFDIPAQPLSTALQAFAQQSGTPMLYAEASTEGKQSPGISGNYGTRVAIEKLVAGSGLISTFANDGTVTLKPGASAMVVAATGNETTLPKVTVEADADNPYDDPTWQTDPYNTDYVLPKATAGTKTDTPIMETPLNIQSVSKQVLKDQQVISLDKALRNVSGVSSVAGADQGFGDQWILRGFPMNTLFRNGFRMDNFNGFDNGQQFANVESVEVMKGPAAILYGRVEPGGMVNITTKQPKAIPFYSFNQQFGSYDLYRTSIDTTGPITKDGTLLYRMNASFQKNNTFRDFVKNKDVFLAPIVRWNISPRTQATLEMEYQHQNTNYDPQVLPFRNNQLVRLPPSRNLMERNPLEIEQIFAGFNWSHQFNDDWSIKHQVNFKRRDEKLGLSAGAFLPADAGVVNNANEITRYVNKSSPKTDTIATILDITGHFKTWGLEHTLLFGGDYYRFDFYQDNFDAVNPFSVINFNQPVYLGNNITANPQSRTQFKQYADNYGFYVQDQIKLPYNLHAMAGFRYQYVHQATELAGADGKFTLTDFRPPRVDEAVTPRFGLVWQPEKWISFYGNYAESFGPNFFAQGFGGVNGKPLPPTSAQQFEIGTKVEFFKGRLRATLAYYDLTKQNIATTDFNHPSNACGGGFCSIAVGEARSRGPELDIQGEILPGWNIIATYANQDVRVTKSNETDGTAALGNRLQFVPRNIGSLWTTYEAQQGELKGFKFGGGIRVQDSVTNAANTIKSPGYALVGLLAGYSFEVGKSKITAQLNVDNFLDKTYVTNVVAQPGANFANVTFSTPRTFMGSINVQY
jgi:iron complex outermembrane receptor protein